ncbi:MAG TPA: hypothetical protein GXZ45_01685 [Propionibacterium sp.]|nr:hypothetical protein [Propionibacterium sp.]
MLVMIFTMLVVLVLAAGVIAVVVMGMEGTGRQTHPEIASAMARTARHLNGEGEPPRALVQLFDEIDEVGDLNVRELPGKLRTLGSAATAASARSARTAWSALSARSAASANPPEAPADTDDEDLEPWAPTAVVPEASEVDESAAQAMGAALAAPVDEVLDADPYGVLAAPDPEHEGGSGLPEVDGDTVVRVHLPEGEPRP